LNELEEVLDTHLDCILRSIACGVYVQWVLLRAEMFGYRQQVEAGEEVTIARTTSRNAYRDYAQSRLPISCKVQERPPHISL
jgi:hypothetical protein